jgi:N-acetylated-alpha-linked acidic dipeptidase
MQALKKSSQAYSELVAAYAKSPAQVDRLNKTLYQAEQKLMIDAGLPRRPWYKHSIYAPGYYTGYGVKTLPGIREAIEQRNWKEAQEQIDIAAAAIGRYTKEVGTSCELLDASKK